jgi:IclR family transcriptional regulator, KDG regulon repressor
MSEHRAAKRSLELIEQVATAQDAVSLTELARALDLPKSSTHALARTLTDEGFLDRGAESGRYSAGPRLVKLVHALQGQFRLSEVAHPIMQDVAQDLGETILLGVRRNQSIYYIDQIEAPQPLRFVPPVGEPRPLHCTSIGKLFLAFMTPALCDSVLGHDALPSYTEFTLLDREALNAELDAVRVRGFATNREESMAGLSAVAVPIWRGNDAKGTLVAGLSAAGPTDRMLPRFSATRDRLLVAAQTIAERV